MQFMPLAASLLFLSGAGLAVADTAFTGFDGTEIAGALAREKQTLSYGEDRRQKLDFWRAKGGGNAAPLVLFVHGGGWARGSKDNGTGNAKGPHYVASGYNFASMNYRLVPEATVEQQAQDVADAVAMLLKQAGTLGIDRHRVVLMGHSAGAHLVALVGTDPQYLRAAGLSERDIAGVVPIDGAAYDVPAQMKVARGPWLGDMFENAFGNDVARQRALSPTLHAASPNAPAFLVLHVQRADGKRQSEALAAALRKAGTDVTIREFPGKGLSGHAKINRSLGDPKYEATPVVDAWLKKVFG